MFVLFRIVLQNVKDNLYVLLYYVFIVFHFIVRLFPCQSGQSNIPVCGSVLATITKNKFYS